MVCFIRTLLSGCLMTIARHVNGQVASDTLYLEQGVRYWLIQSGKGKPAGSSATVWLRYTVRDQFQTLLDASGEEGIVVSLKEEGWIQGWKILLPNVQKGSKIGALVPASAGYGNSGQVHPNNVQQYIVPPHTDLFFEMEILSIK